MDETLAQELTSNPFETTVAAASLSTRLLQDCLGWPYYGTVLYSRAALRFLVEQVTAQHVVLGSNYPFPLGDAEPVRSVREAQLSEAETRAILGENAQTLWQL
jgi:predicted TIM-barrel fold metal-dependent hydrolase